MTYSRLYSGIVINQNGLSESQANRIPLAGSSGTYPNNVPPSFELFPSAGVNYSQTFVLPPDYARNGRLPPLTGLQLFVDISDGQQDAATLDWTLAWQTDGTWQTLADGSQVGAIQSGRVWIKTLFDPVPVTPQMAASTFRITFGGSNINAVAYTVPNPLQVGAAYDGDDNPILDGGRQISTLFRVLGGVADGGTDFLGNVYRSAAVPASTDFLDPGASGGYWLSRPNPSQFAVESLYFDVRELGNASVVDRFTIDPITTGVFFHVYYSNDVAGPGTDRVSWENLLWTPIYKAYQLARKGTYALPEPIAARYIKLEFSNLQPRSYDPGSFQGLIRYEKFPKWVLDYFIARFSAQENDFLSSGVDITYDALDLAYSYYSGDIITTPDPPALLQTPATQQSRFVQQQTAADQVDPLTLSKIKLNFQPFESHPAFQGDSSSVLGSFAVAAAALNAVNNGTNYPVETIAPIIADTTVVSNFNRDPLILEKGFPVMSFFVPCRHQYRIVQSSFQNGVGYFVGLNTVAFHRDNYHLPADPDQFNEILADGRNAFYDDFVSLV